MRVFLLVCLLAGLTALPAQAAPSPASSPTPVPARTAAPPTPTFFGVPKGNRWVAASLSLGLNGLGQYYNGDNEKGNLMLGSLLLFPPAWAIDTLTGKAYGRILAFTAMTMVKAWSVWDAYQEAPSALLPSAAPGVPPSPALSAPPPSAVPSH